MLFFPSLVNGNSHLRKYSNNRPYTIAQILHELQAIVRGLRDIKGAQACCIVQPVGESQTADAEAFEAFCVRELPGWALVSNGAGGRPPAREPWARWRAWHPTTMGQTVPRDALAVSDTGSILRELSGTANAEAHHYSTDYVRAWLKHVKACGCPAAVVYGFRWPSLDRNSLKALRSL